MLARPKAFAAGLGCWVAAGAVKAWLGWIWGFGLALAGTLLFLYGVAGKGKG